MGFNNVRKPTSLKVSDQEKWNAMVSTGTTNFSKAFRELLSSPPINVDEEIFKELVKAGLKDQYAFLEQRKVILGALRFATSRDYFYEEERDF